MGIPLRRDNGSLLKLACLITFTSDCRYQVTIILPFQRSIGSEWSLYSEKHPKADCLILMQRKLVHLNLLCEHFINVVVVWRVYRESRHYFLVLDTVRNSLSNYLEHWLPKSFWCVYNSIPIVKLYPLPRFYFLSYVNLQQNTIRLAYKNKTNSYLTSLTWCSPGVPNNVT